MNSLEESSVTENMKSFSLRNLIFKKKEIFSLSKFKNLKELDISFVCLEVNFEIKDLLKVLSEITCLETLKLNRCKLNFQDLIEILNNNNIKKLEVTNIEIEIDEEKINEIFSIYRKENKELKEDNF